MVEFVCAAERCVDGVGRQGVSRPPRGLVPEHSVRLHDTLRLWSQLLSLDSEDAWVSADVNTSKSFTSQMVLGPDRPVAMVACTALRNRFAPPAISSNFEGTFVGVTQQGTGTGNHNKKNVRRLR